MKKNGFESLSGRSNKKALKEMTGGDLLEILFGPRVLDEETKTGAPRIGGAIGDLLNRWGISDPSEPGWKPPESFVPWSPEKIAPVAPEPGNQRSLRNALTPDRVPTGGVSDMERLAREAVGIFDTPAPTPPQRQTQSAIPRMNSVAAPEMRFAAPPTNQPTDDFRTGNPLVDTPINLPPFRALSEKLKREALEEEKAKYTAPAKPPKSKPSPLRKGSSTAVPNSSDDVFLSEEPSGPMTDCDNPTFNGDTTFFRSSHRAAEVKQRTHLDPIKASVGWLDDKTQRRRYTPVENDVKDIKRYNDVVQQAGRTFDVDPKLISAVLVDERQRYNEFLDPLADITKADPSRGIGQVKTSTARSLLRRQPILRATFPEINPGDNEAIARTLDDDPSNIMFIAAALKDVEDQWRPPIEATVRKEFAAKSLPINSTAFRKEVKRRIDIAAATMYCRDVKAPHGNPQPSDRAKGILDYMKKF